MTVLPDVTVLIPARFDSTGRARNLKVVLRYLLHHFRVRVLLGEEGERPRAGDFLPEFQGRLEHVFLEARSEYFHKTRCLNALARMARTDLVLTHDTDVLLPPGKYLAARDLAARGCHMVLPFGGRCLNVEEPEIARIHATLSLDGLSEENCPLRHPDVYGGAAFLRREAYFEAGLENERMYGWGCEDDERVRRLSILGCRIARIPGPIFHLAHPRPPGLIGPESPRHQANLAELRRIEALTPEQLRAEVAGWEWAKPPA
jgi:hypothetical protein